MFEFQATPQPLLLATPLETQSAEALSIGNAESGLDFFSLTINLQKTVIPLPHQDPETGHIDWSVCDAEIDIG